MPNKNFVVYEAFSIDRKKLLKLLKGNAKGALIEYYKCLVSKDQGTENNRFHWCTEYVRILNEDIKNLLNIEFKSNYDLIKIYSEVKLYIKSISKSKFIHAHNLVQKEYKIRFKIEYKEIYLDRFINLLESKSNIDLDKEIEFMEIPEEQIYAETKKK